MKNSFKYLVLIFLVCMTYYSSLYFGFIWDDFSYIVNNSSLGVGTSFFDLWSFKRVNVDFWPVSYSYFWTIRQFFGENPFYFHLFNVVLFLISVLLLFNLLSLVRYKNAFLVSVIYALHPMNVSLVAWCFQAKTNLANVFGLLCSIFLFYSLAKTFNKKIYVLSILFFTLSLLSKINLIFLPVIFVLSLYTYKKESLIKSIIYISPFFILSFLLGIQNILWSSEATPTLGYEAMLESNYLNRFFAVSKNFYFYFYKTFFPNELMFSYPKYTIDRSDLMHILPSIFVVLLFGYYLISLFKRKKNNFWVFSLVVSFFILLPTLGLVEVYYMRFSNVAEHYLSLAMIGFVTAILHFLDKNKYLMRAVIIFPLFLGYKTFSYLPDYKSEESVFLAALSKNPDAKIAHDILGSLYKKRNELDKALYHYNESIRVLPSAEPYFNIGTLKERQNLFDEAILNYEKSAELNPYVAQIDINIGGEYSKKLNEKVAIEYYKRAISKDVYASTAYYNMGYSYEVLKDINEAKKWYTIALQMSPDNEIYRSAVKRMNEIK